MKLTDIIMKLFLFFKYILYLCKFIHNTNNNYKE